MALPVLAGRRWNHSDRQSKPFEAVHHNTAAIQPEYGTTAISLWVRGITLPDIHEVVGRRQHRIVAGGSTTSEDYRHQCRQHAIPSGDKALDGIGDVWTSSLQSTPSAVCLHPQTSPKSPGGSPEMRARPKFFVCFSAEIHKHDSRILSGRGLGHGSTLVARNALGVLTPTRRPPQYPLETPARRAQTHFGRPVFLHHRTHTNI
ncbi:uncharacterized protein CANTADRAFT_140019 [Suhomyces tanzawaensis NRRL Y-17324]|uniref:Uncharacterized protein n=1 Tax=Suhomyces tanzawaensis NRRL Y-17324 TaxID=984487 RepID=A0A1E4SS33_9ASCO|nr:uncharacterized protein CANTADRAFT_140019 [Suhomyces tanzawaensis NRRL Y-17324]ODV82305.1 hypothetical protein CANTADRAFT_140019 [Suhomyces tanzawaensis NRRL Y-17324]